MTFGIHLLGFSLSIELFDSDMVFFFDATLIARKRIWSTRIQSDGYTSFDFGRDISQYY